MKLNISYNYNIVRATPQDVSCLVFFIVPYMGVVEVCRCFFQLSYAAPPTGKDLQKSSENECTIFNVCVNALCAIIIASANKLIQ